MDGAQRLAKWEHLVQLYNTDSCLADSKILPKFRQSCCTRENL